MILHLSFFERDTVQTARELLGKKLIRKLSDGSRIEALITETEAYDGFEDRASHASRGQTPRNAVMFGPPGYTYLYLCYGMHWMLNITTRETGYPAAILIRGTDAVSGPGRLTKFFNLTGKENALALRPTSGIWISSTKTVIDPAQISATPRIGVDYAGKHWSSIPWRFTLSA